MTIKCMTNYIPLESDNKMTNKMQDRIYASKTYYCLHQPIDKNPYISANYARTKIYNLKPKTRLLLMSDC